MEILVILCYVMPLAFIFIYSVVQLHLAFDFWRKRRKAQQATIPMKKDFVPRVTIQLPVYNELYVVERLLDAIVKLDYPKDRVDVQILDDSTDETSSIIANKIAALAHLGWDLQHIQRDNRKGFKAGALAYGLTFCKGEFVAIFDADFIPHSDFLNKTIPFFKDDKIGVVQTRWEHMNKDYSFFTQMQAFALDAHFVVEQIGRNVSGHFINFNGTAGLWRKSCIADAGGWSADTLTEDLDLSYRAQLKGWKFRYLGDVVTPAELPVAMGAFKSQQFRWTKGAAECAVKNLPRVIKAKNVKFMDKLHAIFHLLNSGIFICIFLLSLSSVPLVYIQFASNGSSAYSQILEYAALGSVNMIMVFFFFFLSYEHTRGFSPKTIVSFVVKFPFFLCLSMGLALHNALAAIEGYRGKKSPFVRTPKFNIEGKKAEKEKNKELKGSNWTSNKYLKERIKPIVIVELCLALFFLSAIVLSVVNGIYGMLPFHIMLFTGYAMITGYSFTHARMIS